MDRRRFLALSASLAAGAGCSRVEAPPDDTVTPVPSPDPTATGTGGAGTVESATVQPGYVGPTTPDSIGVFDDAGQYLLVWLRAEGGAPPRDEVVFEFDGESYWPTAPPQGLYRDDDWAVRYGEAGGPLLFGLPGTGDAGGTRLTWPGGEWVPGETVRERLATPPATVGVALDGPTVVDEDDDPTVAVTVTNESERTGRYVLALNRTGPRIAYTPVARLSGVLDPVGTATHEFDAPSPYEAEPPRETTYRLDAPGEAEDASLTVRPAASATPTGPVTERSPTGTDSR
ncbi:hypothetical protein [Haloarcula litorea]|uniref:hypothetical protein n=1 Tax=Haloarcula litorea TaxID=3032579 RepID=UPI0023E76889|nr:hypothetical protein [Halomicroarcula sp. GDY20]